MKPGNLPSVSRRGVLGTLVVAGAGLLAPGRLFAEACKRLVAADQGPFYPADPIPYAESLLVKAQGDLASGGTVVYLVGRVLDDGCRPVANADVEIWQCDASGQYKHPNAPKKTPIDPNFLYFAKVRSRADGGFRFRTVRPTPYEYFGIKRASHIHMRIRAEGRPVTTTEVYFGGTEEDDLRLRDRVFQSRGQRRGEMVVTLRPAGEAGGKLSGTPESEALFCEYDVTLGATSTGA